MFECFNPKGVGCSAMSSYQSFPQWLKSPEMAAGSTNKSWTHSCQFLCLQTQSVHGDDSIRSLHRPGAFPCLWSSTFVPVLLDQPSFETSLVTGRTAASSPCYLPSPSRLRFSFGKHKVRHSEAKISLPPNLEADYTCKMLFSPFTTHLSGIWSLLLLLLDSNTNFSSPPS